MEWIAENIRENLSRDELEADDILIVLPVPLTARNDAAVIQSALARRNIASHLVGVMTSQDEVFKPGSVAIAHIYRSKGNEAPMVYLANAQRCVAGYELTKMRNTLHGDYPQPCLGTHLCLGRPQPGAEGGNRRGAQQSVSPELSHPDGAGAQGIAPNPS